MFTFMLLLVVPEYNGGSRLLALGERAPLFVLEYKQRALLIDVTPGLSPAERRQLAGLYPRGILAQLPGYRQTQWRTPARTIYVLGGEEAGSEQQLNDFCSLNQGQRQWLLDAFAVRNVQVYSTAQPVVASAPCIVSMQWLGLEWLWLGDLTREAQVTLLDSRKFQRAHFDVVIAWGEDYLGAMFNRLASAQWYLRGRARSNEQVIAGLHAREIAVDINRTASALVPDGKGDLELRPLVTRRSYHPGASGSSF